MIEIEIPKDIQNVESKLVGPFTTKQTVCVVIASAMSILAYNTIGSFFVQNVRFYICLAAALPALLFGWYKPFGMSFWRFLKVALVTLVLAPKIRVYKSENIFGFDKKETATEGKKEKKKKTKKKATHKTSKELIAYQ